MITRYLLIAGLRFTVLLDYYTDISTGIYLSTSVHIFISLNFVTAATIILLGVGMTQTVAVVKIQPFVVV